MRMVRFKLVTNLKLLSKVSRYNLYYSLRVIKYAPTVTTTIVDCLGQLDFVNAQNIFLEHFLTQ